MAYKTKDWRNSMRVTVDYNYMMSKSLGEKGIKDAQLKELKPKAEAAFNYVKENRGKDELYMGWTELPYNQDDIVADIIATAKEIRKKFKYFVVLGIGGSALGPSMVYNALCHLHHNELPNGKRKGPKFYVEDNVDPVRMQALLDVIEPEKTCFNVISKSGATSETMTQYL
ncbi:MAG: glucose-6-phosphate isomerase, partial [Clostridia bacterium]|nr:glucose-6-phosphate isomerase [Clostridia bacterium]